MELLSTIRQTTQSVKHSSLETTAYLRALGANKGLNVAKFHEEIQREMDEKNEVELLYTKYCWNLILKTIFNVMKYFHLFIVG